MTIKEWWKSPVSFLPRAVAGFGHRIAVVSESSTFTYDELATRVERVAGWLAQERIGPGDRVAVLSPNSVASLELHFAVPAAGGVLVMLNTRQHVDDLVGILEHSGARLLICDHACAEVGAEAARRVGLPVVESGSPGSGYEAVAEGLEHVLALGAAGAPSELLAINYTSGTTGNPKGVMYTHEGAYLQSLSVATFSRMRVGSQLLWTLPMFHCNGWCYTWAATAVGATHVIIASPKASTVVDVLEEHPVSHMCGAPTVLGDLAEEIESRGVSLKGPVLAATGGAPPSPALLARLERIGIDALHLYGLTETYGPSVICEIQPEWTGLNNEERSSLYARQGVGHITLGGLRVVAEGGEDVPSDSTSVGELWLTGPTVTPGYFRNAAATETAFTDGWFRTGDLAVQHADGYVEIKDRLKDVIISGGENISSVEVEQAICSHEDVLEAAVVAGPHERWGETPVAFVTLRAEAKLDEADLLTYLRTRLSSYKLPSVVYFEALPKTSTGKVQKYALRERLSLTTN